MCQTLLSDALFTSAPPHGRFVVPSTLMLMLMLIQMQGCPRLERESSRYKTRVQVSQEIPKCLKANKKQALRVAESSACCLQLRAVLLLSRLDSRLLEHPDVQL